MHRTQGDGDEKDKMYRFALLLWMVAFIAVPLAIVCISHSR